MPRSVWKGVISFGLVTIPVELITAEEATSDLALHLLHKQTGARIKQKRVDESTGEEVPWEDIVKGYEYAKGAYVRLDPEELEAANPKATHTIDIVAVVCDDCIERPYFNKPYYIVPQATGRKPYALLRKVLKKRKEVAVARVVLRTRQYLAALYPEGETLVLDLLRYSSELRDTKDLDIPADKDVKISDKEVKLAEQLVDSLAEEWDPTQYKDVYRNEVLDLIKKKVEAGGVMPAPAPGTEMPSAGKVIDIMDLLRKSVEAAKARKGA